MSLLLGEFGLAPRIAGCRLPSSQQQPTHEHNARERYRDHITKGRASIPASRFGSNLTSCFVDDPLRAGLLAKFAR
jgi:hypothetical protein